MNEKIRERMKEIAFLKKRYGTVIPPFLAVSKSRYYATLLASLGGNPPFAVCGLSLL